MKLVVGLGNPGREYEKTRHNLGRRAVISYQLTVGGFSGWNAKEKLFAEIAEGNVEGQKVMLARPLTFMNESGKAVRTLINFYKVKPDNLLVIHDDSDILLGKMKLSYGSRSAGHRGVESIIRALKTKNFWRLRVGIRPPSEEIRKKAEALILEPFTIFEERRLKSDIFPHASESIRAWSNK